MVSPATGLLRSLLLFPNYDLQTDMNILLLGASTPLEHLYGYLNGRASGKAWFLPYASPDALDIADHNLVHLAIVEPKVYQLAALTILQFRERSPHTVIGLLGDDDEIESFLSSHPLEIRQRLAHYYRVKRASRNSWGFADPSAIADLISSSEAWHQTYQQTSEYPTNYKYDVALSFAGEDRDHAQHLADLLRRAGIRIFYDTFEQATLWGKDLFTTLHRVYSVESRYCIVFISKSYVQKLWTVHERRSAQERVLQERDNEYLLPVRVDETALPGLPATVAYLNASSGMDQVAQLFLDKLAVSLAVRAVKH